MVWVKLSWSAESHIANLRAHRISFLWYICDILLCQFFFLFFFLSLPLLLIFFSLNSFCSGRSPPSVLTLPHIKSYFLSQQLMFVICSTWNIHTPKWKQFQEHKIWLKPSQTRGKFSLSNLPHLIPTFTKVDQMPKHSHSQKFQLP